MASYKTNRTEEDILREMTAILRELKDPRIDPMLTVVRAELSRDLSDCKIFVSSLSGQETAAPVRDWTVHPDSFGGNCFTA